MPYRLVQDTISRDTVTALRQLLDYAERGELTGIAFAATFRKMRYITNVAGLLAKNPTFCRGAIRALDDDLALIIRHRDPEETR
jgi:hypothetical protein